MDATQKKLMDEPVILVDESDRAIGAMRKLEAHSLSSEGGPVPLHRAFSLFVFDGKMRLLMQRRSRHKATFPLHWTNTCCSHPLYCLEELGQDIGDATGGKSLESAVRGVKRAAVRKCEHELGLKLEEKFLHFITRIHYAADDGAGMFAEHEIDYVLLYHMPSPPPSIPFAPNEVDETQWMTSQQFETLAAVSAEQSKQNQKDSPGSNLLTPWCRLILESVFSASWRQAEQMVKDSDLGFCLENPPSVLFRQSDGNITRLTGGAPGENGLRTSPAVCSFEGIPKLRDVWANA